MRALIPIFSYSHIPIIILILTSTLNPLLLATPGSQFVRVAFPFHGWDIPRDRGC